MIIIYQSYELDKGEDVSEKIIKQVRAASDESLISCKEALEIADNNGIPRDEMGKLLNRLKIKVRGCQLGCF